MKRQQIIFLQGLPASGKSTWAKDFCSHDDSFVRINKDDIRILLGNFPFSRRFETAVLDLQHQIGNLILYFGKSIVVDDTNFAPKHEQYWRQIARENDFEFILLTFSTSVEECIRRDESREKSVGKHVILDMAEKYLNFNKQKYLDEHC